VLSADPATPQKRRIDAKTTFGESRIPSFLTRDKEEMSR